MNICNLHNSKAWLPPLKVIRLKIVYKRVWKSSKENLHTINNSTNPFHSSPSAMETQGGKKTTQQTQIYLYDRIAPEIYSILFMIIVLEERGFDLTPLSTQTDSISILVLLSVHNELEYRWAGGCSGFLTLICRFQKWGTCVLQWIWNIFHKLLAVIWGLRHLFILLWWVQRVFLSQTVSSITSSSITVGHGFILVLNIYLLIDWYNGVERFCGDCVAKQTVYILQCVFFM